MRETTEAGPVSVLCEFTMAESQSTPTRIIYALQGCTKALRTLTMKDDADTSVVYGLAEAAAMLADQLVERLQNEEWAERLDGETTMEGAGHG